MDSLLLLLAEKPARSSLTTYQVAKIPTYLVPQATCTYLTLTLYHAVLLPIEPNIAHYTTVGLLLVVRIQFPRPEETARVC